MFNIDFNKLINDNLDDFARKPKRVSFLRACLRGIKDLYNDFIAFRDEVFAKIYHTGQVIYLEKRLNDKYDPVNIGIWIDSDLTDSPFYLNRKSEIVPPKYLYKKWRYTLAYVIGLFAITNTNNRVWRATANNTNNQPPNVTYWANHAGVRYLRTKADFFNAINFIVYVPVAVTFDINEMKAIILYYKQAGKNYLIITY